VCRPRSLKCCALTLKTERFGMLALKNENIELQRTVGAEHNSSLACVSTTDELEGAEVLHS
jgi:hypothetical protein